MALDHSNIVKKIAVLDIIPTFDAFNLSLSVISSGGFLIVNNLNELIQTNFQIYIFSFSMLISFFGILLPYNILFLKKKDLSVFTEDYYLLVYFMCW